MFLVVNKGVVCVCVCSTWNNMFVFGIIIPVAKHLQFAFSVCFSDCLLESMLFLFKVLQKIVISRGVVS